MILTNVIYLSAPWQCCSQDRKFWNKKYQKGKGLRYTIWQQFDKFDYHLSEICKKASRKLYTLGRVTPYRNLSAFLKSQFDYCRDIWMCHSPIINKNRNKVPERCLRIIYCDKQSSFEELLEKDSSVSIREEHPNIAYRNV